MNKYRGYIMEKLAKTISIHAICEMELINNNKESSFDYNIDLDLDGNGVIILTPHDANTIFRDAYLISSFDNTDIVTDYSRTFAINLVANMELIGTEDDDYEIGIDDVGQITITPYAAFDGVEGDAKFVSFTEESDTQLITEETEEPIDTNNQEEAEEDTEDIDIESITAKVIEEDVEAEEEGPEWEIRYDLPITEAAEPEVDSNVKILTAEDAETAVKYGEQHARMMAKDDPKWEDAEIISIKKRV